MGSGNRFRFFFKFNTEFADFSSFWQAAFSVPVSSYYNSSYLECVTIPPGGYPNFFYQFRGSPASNRGDSCGLYSPAVEVSLPQPIQQSHCHMHVCVNERICIKSA